MNKRLCLLCRQYISKKDWKKHLRKCEKIFKKNMGEETKNMIKPKSKIQKGKEFENYICEQIMEMGLGYAHREKGSGSGKLKGDIFSNLPFLIEAKNQAKTKIFQWIKQAKIQAEKGNYNRDKWAVIFKEPYTKNCFAVIDMWEFFKLLKKNSEPLIKTPDRELKWRLTRLIIEAKQIINLLKNNNEQ